MNNVIISCAKCGHDTKLIPLESVAKQVGRHPESVRRYWRDGEHQIMNEKDSTVFIERNHYMTEKQLKAFNDKINPKTEKKES